MKARLKESDARRVRSPDRVLICAGCGANRIVLVTTFHTA
jgi:hypothetical protein